MNDSLKRRTSPVILIDIRRRMASLNPAQRKLAQYVADNFADISNMSGTALSHACGISKATLTRFVHDMGFESYRVFQIEVARSLADIGGKSMVYADIYETDSAHAICRKVFENAINALADTLEILNYDAMRRAATLIKGAHRVLIFAQGRSFVTAQSLSNRFYRLGINCFLSCDPHIGGVTAAMSTPEDVAIGISTFGRTRSVLRSMERACGNGTPVIGIASCKDVPMEKYANIMLYTVMNQLGDHDFEPASETVTQMLMIDCIYMMLIVMDRGAVAEKFRKSQSALDEERIWGK